MDIILDCVGAPYLERNMTCLAADGCVVYIGWMGGKAQTPLYGTYTDIHSLLPSFPLYNMLMNNHANAVCSGGCIMLGDA